SAQVGAGRFPSAEGAKFDLNARLGAHRFRCRLAIARFQRLAIHTHAHPGRCPGLLHFAPLALGIRVLTLTLNRWAIFTPSAPRTKTMSLFVQSLSYP